MKILFVCTGNTCRSPMAELVLKTLAKERELTVVCESAGLSTDRIGQPANPKAIQVEAARGYKPESHQSRSVAEVELLDFDLIVGMTKDHVLRLKKLMPEAEASRVHHFMYFVPGQDGQDLVDPYGGTLKDYEYALDLIEVGCDTLVAKLSRDDRL